jgi:hypothetical protein
MIVFDVISSRGKQRTSRLQKTSRDFNSWDFKFSKDFERLQKTSKEFKGLQRTSSDFKRLHEISRDFMRFQETS